VIIFGRVVAFVLTLMLPFFGLMSAIMMYPLVLGDPPWALILISALIVSPIASFVGLLDRSTPRSLVSLAIVLLFQALAEAALFFLPSKS
jgi:hypothetical protein